MLILRNWLGKTSTNITGVRLLTLSFSTFSTFFGLIFIWILSTSSAHQEWIKYPEDSQIKITRFCCQRRPCFKIINYDAQRQLHHPKRHTCLCKTEKTWSNLRLRADLVHCCCSPSAPQKSPSAINLFYVSCFVADKKKLQITRGNELNLRKQGVKKAKTSVGYEWARVSSEKTHGFPFWRKCSSILKAISAGNNSARIAWKISG